MLDKRVPYMDILMRREKGTPLCKFDLPEGYHFTLFKPGDEKDWAIIETSVLEFDCEIDALLYFQKEYIHFTSELKRRCLFVENAVGEKVATSTAWWCYSGVRRDPWLYWVAVKPAYQGMGLGKAVISKVTELMIDIEGDRNLYLHTQTHSHKAVKLYELMGYAITNERNLNEYDNAHPEEAIALLKRIDDGESFSCNPMIDTVRL